VNTKAFKACKLAGRHFLKTRFWQMLLCTHDMQSTVVFFIIYLLNEPFSVLLVV
jgi:hypothetical protein